VDGSKVIVNTVKRLLQLPIVRVGIVLVVVGAGAAIWAIVIRPTAKLPAPMHVLLVASGNDALLKNTRSFEVTGTWTVTYTYSCQYQGDFAYNILNQDGSLSNTNQGINVDGNGGNSTVEYSGMPGRYHLQVDATCPWRIVVKG
jgi:hypothetical protein